MITSASIQFTTVGRHWMNRGLRNTSVIVPKIIAAQNTNQTCPGIGHALSLKTATWITAATMSATVA